MRQNEADGSICFWQEVLLLSPEKQANQSIVKEEDIEEAIKAYVAVMDPVLTSVQKPVARAVIENQPLHPSCIFRLLRRKFTIILKTALAAENPFKRQPVMELLQQIMEN